MDIPAKSRAASCPGSASASCCIHNQIVTHKVDALDIRARELLPATRFLQDLLRKAKNASAMAARAVTDRLHQLREHVLDITMTKCLA